MFTLDVFQASQVRNHYAHIRQCCIENIDNYERQIKNCPDDERKQDLMEKIESCQARMPFYDGLLAALANDTKAA